MGKYDVVQEWYNGMVDDIADRMAEKVIEKMEKMYGPFTGDDVGGKGSEETEPAPEQEPVKEAAPKVRVVVKTREQIEKSEPVKESAAPPIKTDDKDDGSYVDPSHKEEPLNPDVTLMDCKTQLAALIKKERPTAKLVLEKYGAKKISEVAEKDYPEFYREICKKLKELE